MPTPTFTPPATWANGEVTIAFLNARIRDLLIELQNAVTPTAAIDLTLLSGATIEVGKAQVSQYGNSGLVSASLVFSTTGSFQSIAQLPASIVPLSTTFCLASSGAGAIVEVRLSPNGLLEARTHTGTPTRVRFSLPFQV